ncbi:MAG TPA: hypothetical protein VIL53_01135 [Solirubrobacterales bacterium]|jgi:hypothetical protein
MFRKLKARITSAHVISLLALFVALGGTVYAANQISGKTVKKASLPGNRIKKNSVTGKQVKESSLRKVPTATTADTANAAFSTFHDDLISFPNGLAPIGMLAIPKAGSYVINAKMEAFDGAIGDSTADACTLTAGGDVDTQGFDVTGSCSDDQETVALQLVHTFTAPASVVLSCSDGGVGAVSAKNTKITAVQVDSLSNVPF